ncbi:MAG TPA: hypothetical protein VGV67_00525, partial [Solirubrobacteraceae bacterium]|nr:hypothetical protein [Solirubrobacteraceae bacterium]
MRWRNASSVSTLLATSAAAVLGGLVLPAGAHALALNCLVPAGQTSGGGQSALRFGIYPGGPAGSVNPTAAPRPENPAKRLSALQALRGSEPFVVRLYSAWTGDAAADDVSGWLDGEIARYTEAGLQVELAVRYKPATAAGPAEFADYVRGIVRRYGADPGFVSLQVTNEANLPGAPGASDGAFPGAAEAVVKGVIAAKDQSRRDGDALRVGFSWGYDERPLAAGEFWAQLGRLGGAPFAEAVDWVGLDTYPGTWTPQLAIGSLLPGLAAGAVKESVRTLRDCLMPMAGLGRATTIQIAENGFPTGPGRSPELQAQVLDAMVRAVLAIREVYGVSDYRWFDLRDSSSADPNIESQYGITRDDYSPKPAFATYRDLIAGHGGGADAAPAPSAASCRRSPVKVVVPRWKSRRAATLVVQVGKKVVKRLRRQTMPRSVRISMRSGRATVRLKYA